MILGFFCIVIVMVTTTLMAQDHIIYIDSIPAHSESFSSSISKSFKINSMLSNIWSQGYIFGQISSQNDTSTYIYKGDYHEFKIRKFLFLDSSDVFRKRNKNKGVFFNLNNEKQYWSNQGYPFSTVQICDIEKDERGYSTNILVDKGPQIQFDTVFLINEINTSKAYLEKSLSIERGSLYSEKSFRKLNNSISRLQYISLEKEPDIAFEDGLATIYLDLREENTNSFEGILGLLPNQSSGNVLITGYLDLALNNLFQSGKEFKFNWNRFDSKSQSIDLEYTHPFFLDTKLIFDLDFSLLKQDTTFFNQQFGISTGSYLGNVGFWNIGYSRTNANLISSQPEVIKSENILDFKTDQYRFTASHNNYDASFGYKGGWKISASSALGQKRMIRNLNLDESFYDTIKIKSSLINLELKGKYQKIIQKQLAIYQQLDFGAIYNEQVLNNEMYRIGGLMSLRGFNENFFFASQYALSRLELRQYFERKSYFMILYDQLIYKNAFQKDNPFGLGVGFTIASSNSLFNFAVALGKSEGIPMDVSNAKIHFGYTSQF